MSETYGGKDQYLARQIVRKLDAPFGDCVLEAIIQSCTSRPKCTDTPDEIRKLCGLEATKGVGVTLEQLTTIENKYRMRNRKGSHAIGFVVFDMRQNLIRLPSREHRKKNANGTWNTNYRFFIYLILNDRHAKMWQSDKVASSNMTRGLSFFRAYLAMHSSVDDPYTIFRKCQHLQPDILQICKYLQERYAGPPPLDVLELVPAGRENCGVRKAVLEW